MLIEQLSSLGIDITSLQSLRTGLKPHGQFLTKDSGRGKNSTSLMSVDCGAPLMFFILNCQDHITSSPSPPAQWHGTDLRSLLNAVRRAPKILDAFEELSVVYVCMHFYRSQLIRSS